MAQLGEIQAAPKFQMLNTNSLRPVFDHSPRSSFSGNRGKLWANTISNGSHFTHIKTKDITGCGA